MQGDFSRATFDPLKHYSAVLTQQGRVRLDADDNEGVRLLLHQLRTTVADIIGPARAPDGPAGGFAITRIDHTPAREDLAISRGRMYVGGILVENDTAGATYWTQPDLHLDPGRDDDQLPPDGPFVVYLRVWEQLITALQDPDIREIALGSPGPDTAARMKTIWQVAAWKVTAADPQAAEQEFTDRLADLTPTGQLKARAKQPSSTAGDVCHLPPDNLFRGHENQLYRVEVHTGGIAWPAHVSTDTARRSPREILDGATFKWSRENASVVFPVDSVNGAVVKVGSLGRDGKLGLEVGGWVELADDATAGRVADDVVLTGPSASAPRLRKVVAIDVADLLVTLDRQDGDEDRSLGAHPLLRRWDHVPGQAGASGGPPARADDGALPLVEGRWIDLEDGLQVWFGPASSGDNDGDNNGGTYRRGDYWLIPARTATGDVLWPKDQLRPPNGVEYHYAPLAYVTGDDVKPLRKTFVPLAEPAPKTAPAPAGHQDSGQDG